MHSPSATYFEKHGPEIEDWNHGKKKYLWVNPWW
jgi:hypothetical protein